MTHGKGSPLTYWALAAVLTAAAVYAPTLGHGFVGYRRPRYPRACRRCASYCGGAVAAKRS